VKCKLGRLKAFVARGIEELFARYDRIPETRGEIFAAIVDFESRIFIFTSKYEKQQPAAYTPFRSNLLAIHKTPSVIKDQEEERLTDFFAI